MQTEKLSRFRSSTLRSKDNFAWEIKVYDDVTEISYVEYGDDGAETMRQSMDITAGYDVQVLQEALRLREVEINERER